MTNYEKKNTQAKKQQKPEHNPGITMQFRSE